MDEIKNYFCIGDLHSTALISKLGSIDWLCLPHFDSPSLFARLLDKNGGFFAIDTKGYAVSSRYIKDTAIVEFDFSGKSSEFIVHDFMVPVSKSACKNHFLIRNFIGVKGNSKISLLFNPQPNYAAQKPQLKFTAHDLEGKANEDSLLLHPPKNTLVRLTSEGYRIEFDLQAGKNASVVLEYVSSGCPVKFRRQNFERQTTMFWQNWVAKGEFFEFCRDNLVRSAITLKLMQFYPTGAIVAAPTTSLPEVIGGERNWDYRYVWIRDATFTLYALYVLGYLDEAKRFFSFIKGIVKKCQDKDFDVSLMYTIEGKPVPKEKILKQFKGYKGSKPVRIGNGARDQFQLDVYGSLIDAYYFVSKRTSNTVAIHKKTIMNLIDKISQTWQQKDNSIWEIRDEPRDYTYSKVMAWVGVNRVLRMSDNLGLSFKDKEKCQKLEKLIYEWIWENCFDKHRSTFDQYPKSKFQDATNLLFVLLQFLDKHDSKTKTIIDNTCKELSYKDIFVFRYRRDDNLEGKEGAFLLCSFWLISAWAILENIDAASSLFNKFNDLLTESGLLSEEMDSNTKEYLGNFPQAFSHVGYIMSAYYVNRYAKRVNKNGQI